MEIRIKLTEKEVEELCAQKCESLSPAPKGMRWGIRLTGYSGHSGVTCELEPIEKQTGVHFHIYTAEEMPQSPIPVPVVDADEVAF